MVYMPQPRVAIVLVNWNGGRDTIECVSSLRDLDYRPFFVIVVDNASHDDSVERIGRAAPEVTIVDAGANLGFAGGNNLGIRLALDRGADFVWLLNNDTIVDPGALGPLVDEARRTGGLVGSAILRYPDTDVVWAAGGGSSRSSARTWHGYAEQPVQALPHEPFDVGYVPGCSLLFPASSLDAIGPMPEDYFLYFEDAAWCEEAHRHGLPTRCVPASRVFHKESRSTGLWSPRMRYFFVRGAMIFTRAYRRRWLPATWYFLRHHLVNHVLRGRFAALPPTVRGMVAGLGARRS